MATYMRKYRKRNSLFEPLMKAVLQFGREEIKRRGLENASKQKQEEFMNKVMGVLTRAFKEFVEEATDE